MLRLLCSIFTGSALVERIFFCCFTRYLHVLFQFFPLCVCNIYNWDRLSHALTVVLQLTTSVLLQLFVGVIVVAVDTPSDGCCESVAAELLFGLRSTSMHFGVDDNDDDDCGGCVVVGCCCCFVCRRFQPKFNAAVSLF